MPIGTQAFAGSACSSREPLVSILIATYNQEHLIGETIESCIKQTYRNLEIIVVDDASTDAGAEVVASFAKKDSRLRLIRSKVNGGVTVTCNRLLSAASGDLIAFLGGDDLCAPDRIESQVAQFLANDQLSACMSGVDIFFDNGRPSYYEAPKAVRLARSGAALIDVVTHPPTSTLMYRPSLSPELKFDLRMPVVSDWLFVVEVHLAGDIAFIDRPLVRYRRHAANLTGHSLSKYYLADRLVAADILFTKRPDLRSHIRRHRSNVLRSAAKAAMEDAVARSVAIALARSATAENIWNGQAWIMLGLALLPKPTRDRLMRAIRIAIDRTRDRLRGRSVAPASPG